MSGIVDYSKLIKSKTATKHRNENELSFKHPCAALICGHTGCGKSMMLFNLLMNRKLKMSYDRIYLICPNIEEDTYSYLKKYYDDMQEANEAKYKFKLGYPIFTHINKAEDIPKPEDFDKTLQNVVIVDDFMMNPKINDVIENFITMCRKYNTSLIYLSQSYFKVPKNIRLQIANGYCALFEPPSLREVGLYMQEFGLGLTKEEFKKLFKDATKKKFEPLLIDFRNRGTKWQFRRGLITPMGKDEPQEDDDAEDTLVTEL